MFRPIAVVGLVTAGLTLAYAQDQSPQVERHELMEDIGDNAKVLGAMAKGEAPFDADAASSHLDDIIADIEEFVTLFPEGSETGNETRALPTIWENKGSFDDHAQDLADAATTVQGVLPEGQEAFAGAFRDLGRTCGACHNEFRAKKG